MTLDEMIAWCEDRANDLIGHAGDFSKNKDMEWCVQMDREEAAIFLSIENALRQAKLDQKDAWKYRGMFTS